MQSQMIKKRIFWSNLVPQSSFYMKSNAPQARLIKQNAPQGRLLSLSPHGYSVLLMQYVMFFPRITAQNLLLFINSFVNLFVN